jgi:hypothetical protein
MGGTATALAQDTVTAIDGFAVFADPGRRLAGFDTKTVESPPVLVLGNFRDERVPNVLIAHIQPDRGSYCKVVKELDAPLVPLTTSLGSPG